MNFRKHKKQSEVILWVVKKALMVFAISAFALFRSHIAGFNFARNDCIFSLSVLQ